MRLKSTLLLVLAIFLCAVVTRAQTVAAGYTFLQSSSTYTPITGGTVQLTSTSANPQDDVAASVTLPFTFTFNGAAYSSIYVSSNGYVTFGTTSPSTTAFEGPISSTRGFNGVISAFGEDLIGTYSTTGTRTNGSNNITNVSNVSQLAVGMSITLSNGFTGTRTITAISGTTVTVSGTSSSSSGTGTTITAYSGEVRTQTLGTGTNQAFVIQFKSFQPFGDNNDYVNFQIRLNQGNNIAANQTIDVVYGSLIGVGTGSTSQVGLRGASNSFAAGNVNNRQSTTSWTSTTAGTANTSAITYSNTLFPASGLTYTWAPVQITTGTLGASSYCPGAAVSVPFTSTGTYTSNTYTAQLSNASGSFASPTNIGTLTSNANTGTVSATIPAATAGGTGYRIRVISNGPAVTGSDNGSNITIVGTLAAPAAPTGTAAVCAGNSYTYTVGAVSGASSYNWVVPSGWTITSTTPSTNTITVTAGSSSGSITAAAVNSCGIASAASGNLAVTASPGLPTVPNAITGSASVCIGSGSVAYSITGVTNVTTSSWAYTPSTGVTINNGNTLTPTIVFGAGATSGTLTYTATNGCGNTSSTPLSITVSTPPAAPGSITGSATPCINSTGNSYSVTAVPGATSYIWSYNGGTGATITGTSTSVTIAFAAGATNGNLTVIADNGNCQSTASTPLAIALKTIPATPGALTGTTTVCEGIGQAYSFTPVTTATGYTWNYTPSTGAAFTPTTTTANNTYTFAASAVSGNLTVTADNTCGSSAARTVAIIVNHPPATPTAPTALVYGTSTFNTASGSFTGSGATGYIVVRSTGALAGAPANGSTYATGNTIGTNGTVVQTPSATTSFSQAGLTSNTTYTYTVFAYNTGNCTTPVYSTALTNGTVTTCAAATGTPTSNTVNQVSFNVTWTAAPTGGGTGPISYTVEVSGNAGFTAPVTGYNPSPAQAGTTLAVTGLNANTIYWYRVTASNGVCGTVSAVGSQLTSPVPTATITSSYPAAGTINQNTTNDPIAAFRIAAANAAITPTGISITTAGTYTSGTDISTFKIWQGASATSLTTQVGTLTATASGTILTYTLSGATAIAAGATSYLIVTADAPSTAVDGKTVFLAGMSNLNGFTFSSISPVTNTGTTPGVSLTQTIVAPKATIAAAHPAAGDIIAPSNNNIISSYQVVGANVAITPTALSVTTAGTYNVPADIATFKVYQNTTNSFTGATQIGTLTATASGSVLNFTLSGASAIASGATNYLLVTADVLTGATINNTVYVTATPLANFGFSSTGSVTVTGTDPVAASNPQTILKEQVTITAVHSAAGNINQNTTNNIIAAIKLDALNGDITPTSATFTTTGTYVAGNDVTNFKLYQNTTNAAGGTLIGTLTATATGTNLVFNTGFTPILDGTTNYLVLTADIPNTATNAKTVSITSTSFTNLTFTGAHTVSRFGTNPVPASNAQTIVAPQITIGTVHPAASNIIAGSTDNIVGIYKMDALNAGITPTGLSVTTAGTYTATTDITTFKLYQNITANLAGTPTLVGTVTATASGTVLNFTGTSNPIAAGTSAYFIVTADVALNATATKTVSLTATPLTGFAFTSTGAVTVVGTAAVTNTKTIAGQTVTIAAANPGAANINQNSADNIIGAFSIANSAGTVSVTPASVKFTTGGSYLATSDVSTFKVYQNATNNLAGTPTLIGSLTATASGTTLMFTGAFTPIAPGATSFIIFTADIPTTAINGRAVSTATTPFTNITFTGTVVKAGTDPVAAAAAKIIVGPQITVTGQAIAAGNIIAGSVNNIFASYKLDALNAAITPTGLSVTTSGSYVATTDITTFKLYQNTTNNLAGTPTLIGTLTATASGTVLNFTGTGTSIAAGASAYLLVTTDVALNATAGRTLNVTTTPLANFSFTSTGTVGVAGANPAIAPGVRTIAGQSVALGAQHPVAGFIDQNTTNNIIARLTMINAAGGVSVTPSSITLTTAGTYTAGSDITNFKLYQNTANTVGGTLIATLTATASGTNLVFTGAYTPIAPTATNYFILTADVPLTALNGKNVSITSTSFNNINFTGTVTETGTPNPIGGSNAQTIRGPQATITQVHPVAGGLGLATADNIIASYKIDAANAALTPANFSFTTAGAYIAGTDITQFSLYQNTVNSLSGSPTLVGTITATSGAGMVLTFNSGFTPIASGATNYFLITADVDGGGTIGNTVNITTTAFTNFVFAVPTTGTVNVTGPTTPVPAGNLQTIRGAQVTITAVHPGAGTLGQNTVENVLAAWRLDVAFKAAIPTGITFKTAGTYAAGTDISQFGLYQNNTNSITGATLIGTVTATASGTTMVIAGTGNSIPLNTNDFLLLTADIPVSGIDGKTVNITTTALNNFTFIDANGSPASQAGTDPSAAGNTKTIAGPRITVTTTHPAASNITTGSTDNIIATYVLTASNVSGTVTPSTVTLITAGSATAADLVNYKIYQNTSNTLAGATLVSTVTAPGTASNIVFTGAYNSMANSAVNYLLVTVDVSPTATLTRTDGLAATPLANFLFAASTGGTVNVLGTNPAAVTPLKTITGPGALITTIQPAASNVAVGSVGNLIGVYKIDVTNAAITPSSVTLSSSGTNTGAADILNFNIYQNNLNSLTGATLVGTITAPGAPATNNLAFNTTTGTFVSIPANTTGYILVTADIAGTATAGKTLGLTATPLNNFTFTSTGTVTPTGAASLPASSTHTILAKVDVYWTGSKTWNNTNTNWGNATGGGTPNPYANSVWIANGIANLEGTAGTISINDVVKASQILNPSVNGYIINSNNTTGNGVTLTSPARVSIGAGTTYFGNNGNPVIYGVNGLTKLGAGEMAIASRLGSTFSGPLNVNAGELTLGIKTSIFSAPYNFLRGNPIVLNGGKLTIAADDNTDGSLRNLTSFTATGISKISVFQTDASTWMNLLPTTDGNVLDNTNGVPLTVSGTMSVDAGTSASDTYGTYGTGSANNQNSIAFGSTTYTGNTTFNGYATAGSDITDASSGTQVNINLGGYGHYITGVTLASGVINDNGFTTTFLGGGNATTDGAELSFNSASSTMTGNWTVGDVTGTNAGWLITNTTTCLTKGAVTVNNRSKLALQLKSTANTNITYSPSVITLNGLGPANWPAALDFYNFSGTNAGTTTLPSNIVLNKIATSNLASIGSQLGGSTASVVFQLNGTVTGAGGFEKVGPARLVLNAQNGSGNINTYADTTRIKDGTLIVNAGSNLGTGPLHFYQSAGEDVNVILNNTAQNIASLSATYTNANNRDQVLTLNGTALTVNQGVNTTFGNNTGGNSVAYIEGTGALIKDGTGTLILTGANTYTGLTQLKAVILQLNKSGGTTIPATNDVHVVDGKLIVSTAQTVNNLVLSKGTLQLDANVVVNGTFTYVDGAITGAGTLTYGATGAIIYAGSIAQITSTKELPATSGPKTITFSNYSTAGVKLNANIALTSGVVVTNGLLDLGGKTISGTGTPFTLNGPTNVAAIPGTRTSGSTTITNIVTSAIKVGMQVAGTGIPAGATVIYIDPLVAKTIILNTAATAAGTANLTFGYRGGLVVTSPTGVGGHILVNGTKTYNQNANFKFGVPITGNQIYPALPKTGTGVVITYPYTAWDVTMDQLNGTNHVVLGANNSMSVAHDLALNGGVLATGDNLLTFSNTNGGTFTYPIFATSSTAYTNSWIATCQFNGAPATIGIPYTGGIGFRYNIINLTGDNYFPVGADFVSPNRMMVNLEGAPTRNLTVIVGKGDIGNTGAVGHAAPRVNRIWYVNSNVADSIHSTMKLYYTHHFPGSYPALQDELETGWIGSQTRLVQKQNLSDTKFINVSNASTQDNFMTGTAVAGHEYYALLRPNADTAYGGGTPGIYTFSYYSIVDGDGLGVVLPVTFTSIKAYKQGTGVNVDWTVANEINIDHYELQRAGDGSLFTTIGKNAAGSASGFYMLPDATPLQATNYYRIKSVGKDGQVSYTNIVNVTFANNGSASMLIYPNPVTNNQFTLKLNSMIAGHYNLVVTSIGGKQILVKQIEIMGGLSTQKVYVPAGTASGIYTVQLVNPHTNMRTNIFISH